MKMAGPALHRGKYGIVITNPDGETASVDASSTLAERVF
jgi:hypothetical protein